MTPKDYMTPKEYVMNGFPTVPSRPSKASTLMEYFTDYVNNFYGSGGLHPTGGVKSISHEDVAIAVGIRLERFKHIMFDGDTTDREFVRDILIERGVINPFSNQPTL